MARIKWDIEHLAAWATRVTGADAMAVNAWVDRHPYLGFAIFLALVFGLMALCGLDDYADRVASLSGRWPS